MELSDKFCMAAVMGWPVMHSRSPLMHNYWMAQQQLTGTYVPLAIEPGQISPALRAMPPLGFAGCNLTGLKRMFTVSIIEILAQFRFMLR